MQPQTLSLHLNNENAADMKGRCSGSPNIARRCCAQPSQPYTRIAQNNQNQRRTAPVSQETLLLFTNVHSIGGFKKKYTDNIKIKAA